MVFSQLLEFFWILFNPFVPNAPFLYPPENRKPLRFSDVFRWYRKGALGTNGSIYLLFDSNNFAWKTQWKLLRVLGDLPRDGSVQSSYNFYGNYYAAFLA